MTEKSEILTELKRIENKIDLLTILLLKGRRSPNKIAKLEGSLKGEITEEEIEDAKKSLFDFRDIYD